MSKEAQARSTVPGMSFGARRENKQIVLDGLVLDELRALHAAVDYNNELLKWIGGLLTNAKKPPT